ncbi:hypothetical protein ACIA03_05175 [Nocardioides sp. NPDC051685]|uniref:hypothetical protein n=1 Tax=Nocardioides sp. NPDC051685 TaxID=3364334 RepID=UPI00378FC563
MIADVTPRSRPAATAVWSKVAAAQSGLLGVGFGIPAAYGTYYFATHDNTVWIFLGFPTNGDGPFVDVGIPTSVPLLVGFTVVCAVEVVVGLVLWTRPRLGGWLSIALLPFELAYWWGFALPFGPIGGLVRTVAVVMALRRGE